jgi:hypothetical protein
METITITFCETAENHVGMQKLGQELDSGLSLDQLTSVYKWFCSRGVICDLYDLNWPIVDSGLSDINTAYILVVRNGVSFLSDNNVELMDELKSLNWDTKALMYGRVVNKKARHNLCFASESQEADYQNGKGTVISFDDVPLLNDIRNQLQGLIDVKSELLAEGNYYYDISKCGIGFHGDAERKIVIGMRLGASMPLDYQWYINSKPVGSRMRIEIDDGDFYFMSEKATGNDWKKKSIYTLRHAAGAEKFLLP